MWIKMKAKHDGWCRRCYKGFKKDTLIQWHPTNHTTRHVGCDKATRLTLSHRKKKR